MASNRARDGRLSPRAMLMWLVIKTPAVSASQSSDVGQTQSKERADSNILDAPLARIPSWQGTGRPLRPTIKRARLSLHQQPRFEITLAGVIWFGDLGVPDCLKQVAKR